MNFQQSLIKTSTSRGPRDDQHASGSSPAADETDPTSDHRRRPRRTGRVSDPDRLAVVRGLPGAAKSTAAAGIADRVDGRLLRTDLRDRARRRPVRPRVRRVRESVVRERIAAREGDAGDAGFAVHRLVREDCDPAGRRIGNNVQVAVWSSGVHDSGWGPDGARRGARHRTGHGHALLHQGGAPVVRRRTNVTYRTGVTRPDEPKFFARQTTPHGR